MFLTKCFTIFVFAITMAFGGIEEIENISNIKQLFGQNGGSYIIGLEMQQHNYAASQGYFIKIDNDKTKNNDKAYQAYFNGDYQKSILICKKINLDLKKAGNEETWLAFANENNLALLYQSKEAFQKALTHYEKALYIGKKLYGDESSKTAILYGNMAIYYQLLGNQDKSLKLHNKALRIREKKLGILHRDTALSYQNIGSFYQNEFTYMNARAYEYYYRALIIRKRVLGKDHIDTVMTYSALSSLNYEENGFRTGMKYAYSAMVLALKHVDEDHIKMATIYRNLGKLSYWMGNAPQSQKYLKKALAIRKRVLGNDHILTLEVYRDLILLGIDDYDNFLKRYKYAVRINQVFLKKRDMIFPILGEEEKKLYMRKYKEHIALLLYIVNRGIGQLYKENRYTEADKITKEVFNIWLNYKGSIFDSENAIASLYEITKDKKIKKQIDLLYRTKRKLAKLYQSLPKPKEREQWKQQIKTTEQEITQLNKLLSTKTDKIKQQHALDKINSKILASVLKKDELYIDYAEVDGYYYIFTLDSEENISFEKIYGYCLRTIEDNIPSFRKDIDTILGNKKLSRNELSSLIKNSQNKLSDLYTCVFNMNIIERTKEQKEGDLPGPKISLEKQLQKKKSLIISPDSALRLLPFEALYNKKKHRYLIEEKDIRYVPSGKELLRLHKFTSGKTASNKDVVIFYNPDYNQKITSGKKIAQNTFSISSPYRSAIIKSLFRMRFSPLPGTKIEAKKIEALLKNQIIDLYSWENATESNLFTIEEPKILHIATHGFFLNDDNIPNPMLKSGIALSGANSSAIHGSNQGIVTALKLSGLDLKGTELVVLSACQTGVVDINSTEIVSGLSKAFIQAGSRNLIISLWNVDDRATVNLMTSFYSEAKKSHNFSRALKKAKLKMIQENKHPFYWAPFILYGL